MAVMMAAAVSASAATAANVAARGYAWLNDASMRGSGANRRMISTMAIEKCRMLMSRRLAMHAAVKIVREIQRQRQCSSLSLGIGETATRILTATADTVVSTIVGRKASGVFKAKMTGK